jgi:DNA-binding GntR family transcriptional regulator
MRSVSGAPAIGAGPRRVERPRSLTAIVLEQIRDRIVTGQLRLGEQLSENVLAEQLGVSRTPVREAFLKLAAERLVEVRPQRGTFVFACGHGDVRDICALREILEAGALRLAVERDRSGLLHELEANVAAAERVRLESPVEYQPYDHAFHELIVSGSGNRELTEAYAQISGRVRALRHRLIRTLEHVAGSQAAHRAVAAAVRAGDDAGAETALRHHVYSSYRALDALLDDGESIDGPGGPTGWRQRP